MKSFIKNIEFYLIAIIAFAIPLEKRLVPYIITAYVVHYLFSGNLKEKISVIFKTKYLLVTTGYYFFLIIGCFYSEQLDEAIFDLEVKFSLLIFPLMMSSLRMSKRQFNLVIAWFIGGCFIAFAICLSYAILFFYSTQDISSFYYDKLSVFHHVSYFSMYLNFAILFLYNYLIYDTKAFKWNSVTIYVLLIVLFSTFVVLLSSKIGLITLLLIIITGTIFWFLKSRAIFPSIMVFTMLTTMIFFSFKYSAIIQSRITEAFVSLSDEEPSMSSTGSRMLIWKTAVDMILEKPFFGYGTGDVKYELVERYKEHGYKHLVESKYNAHNQYIQMLIAIGIIGSLIFWLYLYYFMLNYKKYLSFVFMGFVLLISLNFLTESMLETQAGVVFFAFFNAFLFFNQNNVVKLDLNIKKS